MEIERHSTASFSPANNPRKQRKSPENGDWKVGMGELDINYDLDAKQRKSPENGDWKHFTIPPLQKEGETKKISWKWRLKDESHWLQFDQLDHETKKISWKWRLKEVLRFLLDLLLFILKQRKSPENGDWKASMWSKRKKRTMCETKKISWKWRLKEVVLLGVKFSPNIETKKISWKWRLKGVFCPLPEVIYREWNKENLLKMEIESRV